MIKKSYIDEFSIHLVINLINTRTSIEDLKNIIRDSALNLNCQREYFTHEADGINSTIKNNNIIYIIEFDNLKNLEEYIKFIKSLNKIKIQLICNENTIIYMSKQYKKSIDTNQINIVSIEKTILEYKNNNIYNKLYKLL